MAGFLSDWRNPALVVALLAVVILGGMMLKGGTDDAIVFTVGDTSFRESEVVNELREQSGNQVVSQIINAALIEQYARRKGVEATDAEIDQLLRFNENGLWMEGQELSSLLEKQGISKEAFRKRLRTQVLQVKLLVSEAEMRKAVEMLAKEGKAPFAMPERARIRIFSYDAKAAATKAIAMLQNKERGVIDAASLASNLSDAQRILLYPGMINKSKEMDEVLKKLKDGECSEPIEDGGKFVVVQVVEKLPAQQPTFANSNIIAGQVLLQTNKEFAMKARDMEAEAMENADIAFYSDDYDEVREIFKKKRLSNPRIPGFSPGTTPAPTKSGKE